MILCNLESYPCCKDHHPKCNCCGDSTDRIIRKGKRPGAFCHDCYGELFHNRIPPLRPSRSSGMSAKARLRYRQDMA